MDRPQSATLAEAQRRIWHLVTEPEGVRRALIDAGDGDGARLAGWIRDDRGVGAVERLSVYANAYFARLHDCLRDDFGALARSFGAEAFHDLVKTYLMMHPPTRPSLRHAGSKLAEHLACEPFAEIFSRLCPYGRDLARLEWSLAEAFAAPDAAALSRDELAVVSADAWAGLRFVVSPSLQILDCDWPVQRIRASFDADGESAAWSESIRLAAEPVSLLVFRRDDHVRYRACAPLEREAVARITAGETFAEACEPISQQLGSDAASPQIAAWLSTWVSDGLLVGLRR